MQHLDEGTIHSWLDGALGPDEAARVEAHAAECPECAAAVAEARGFIAASSRILTALDHVPRGVVPAARPARWGSPAVWRAAAAVLVVAAGSLVVVRNRGNESAPLSSSAQTVVSTPTTAQAAPMTIMDSSSPTSTGGLQPNNGPTQKATSKKAATAVAAADQNFTAPAPSTVADARKARAPSLQPNIPANARVGVAAQAAAAGVAEKSAPSQGYASVQASPLAQPVAPPQILIRGATAGMADRDSLNALVPLKVVGTRRQLGAKVTLYEVAPNDTVTLTELTNLRLEAVVTTGMPTVPSRERSAKSVPAAAAPAPTQRADADADVSAQDSRREPAAAPARAPSAPAPVTGVETTNGVTTITWKDANTGNVLKLSGRKPVAQLVQLKVRIERERAAASAAAGKTP